MSHCLTAPSPKLSGYSVTSNILPPAPTTHGEWPGTGSTQPARRGLTKKSLTRCAERKGSTHIAQCHEAHSAPCRSRDQQSVGNSLHFCAASLELKDAGWKTSNPERMRGCCLFFFFLPWTAASNPCGKANLRGLKKEKKKNTWNGTNCCHWTWLCSKVCQSWDWLGCMVSRKQSVPSAGYKAILIVSLPPWQP